LQAYQQLRAAEQSSRGQQPTVWASAVVAGRIAFATPDPDRQALLFHFSPALPLPLATTVAASDVGRSARALSRSIWL